jgi:hypothetical protein
MVQYMQENIERSVSTVPQGFLNHTEPKGLLRQVIVNAQLMMISSYKCRISGA